MLIRPIEAVDKDFVYDSWFKSYRKNEYAGIIPNHLYYNTMLQAVEGLIGRGASIDVAVEGETILGWICHEVTSDGFAVVHFWYVKERYTKFNVLPQLMDRVQGKKPGFKTAGIRVPGSWAFRPEIARREKA